MHKLVPVRVDYSDSPDQLPVRVWTETGALTILAVEDRWDGDGYCWFRVFIDNGETRLLRRDDRNSSWWYI